MTPTPHPGHLSRRKPLRAVGLGAAGAAGAGLLSSCAGGDAAPGGTTRFTGVFGFDLDAQTRNVAVEDGALLMNSVYADLSLPAGAFYNWETHEWDHLLLEGSAWEGDDEHTEFNAEFIEFSPEEIITSGPYTFDRARTSDARITLVREESGYQGTEVAFDEVVVHRGDNRQAALLVQQGEVDYSPLATAAADQQAFQTVEGFRWGEHPGYDGRGLMFNFRAKPELRDPRARKALKHVLDGDQIGRVARGEAYDPVKYYAGLVDLQAEQIFTAEELEGFDTYDQDMERATELLEEAGWTKEGGVWHTPEGEEASYEIIGVAGWGTSS